MFLDVHTPDRVLLIVGAGHVGQKLSSLGKLLDYQVIVLDPRQDMVTRSIASPMRTSSSTATLRRASELVPIGAATHVVIVTHGHAEDAAALRSVLGSEAGSVGMIGSARKVKKIFEQLRSEGVTAERLEAVHAPIGLDIGAETPAEIALSIMAEIVADAQPGA